MIEIGDLADEGVRGLDACVVDGDFSQQLWEGDLHDEALEVVSGVAVDEDGGVLSDGHPVSDHIRYAQMKTAILPHIINNINGNACHFSPQRSIMRFLYLFLEGMTG